MLFRVARTDAGQVLDLIKAAPESALHKLRRCGLLQAPGLTYNFLQNGGVTPNSQNDTQKANLAAPNFSPA